MNFEELKTILTEYGEKLDEEDIELFEQAMKVNDGKIIVDGNIEHSLRIKKKRFNFTLI